MSYVFNELERQQIIMAIQQCTGLTYNPDSIGQKIDAVGQAGTNVEPLYTLLSNILATKLTTPELFDSQTNQNIQDIKRWMDVAIRANTGEGSQVNLELGPCQQFINWLLRMRWQLVK